MNPTATHLNPVNAPKNPSENGRPAAAAPDVSFNQMLTSEMEQNRNSAKIREENREEATSEAAAASTDSTQTDTAAATQTEAGVATPDAPPPSDAGKIPPETQNLPGTPDAMLALVMQGDLLKSALAVKDSALAENTTGSDAGATLFDTRQGAARPAWLASQASDEAAGTRKIHASLTGQADVHAAQANTVPYGSVAAAFAGQLAATRQSDLKAGERLPDFLSNPSLATPSQPLVDAATPLNNVAANTLTPSVGATAWGQALGDKIVWMAAGAQQTASLTLNPPNLGPLQIVLNLTNDQATASFFTAQPEVRQALEAAFPKLRDMMSEVGIQLGQATVSAETPRQNDTPERQAQRAATPFGETRDAIDSHTAPLPIRQSGRGLVDTFA